MLHLISQSPIESSVLERIETGDSVVFVENAVFRILRSGSLDETLSVMSSGVFFYVLEDELSIRGIEAKDLVSGIEVITYKDLVELTVKHSLIQSWM